MVSVVTRVAIWGRAGGRCSHPECRRSLTVRVDQNADPSLIGETCHIKAKSAGGPRYDKNYPTIFVDSFDNLMLLCAVHHKIIDDNPETFTVEKLKEIKKAHENWIETQLSDTQKDLRTTREKYSFLVASFEEKLRFSKADMWLSRLGNNAYPVIELDFADTLFDFATWAGRQFTPHTIPAIEAALFNLVKAIDDYCHYFAKHSSRELDGYYSIPQFYRIEEWNEEKYNRLSDKWHRVITKCRENAVEIAQALNLVVKVVRRHIIEDYRVVEGWFIVPGVRKISSLSASTVPRYPIAKEGKILASLSYKKFFNSDALNVP